MKLTFLFLAIGMATLAWGNDECLFIRTVVPDVMIIFDNSGSMTFDCVNDNFPYWGGDAYGDPTGGDGSENYPGRDADGNGLPDDSRMYILKRALTDVISGVRTYTNLGLITFGFNEDNQPYPTEPTYWYDVMVEPLPETTMVINQVRYGHIRWPRRRRCWNVRVDDYPWWYRYDRIWTVEETSWVWLDTIMDPARTHYEILNCAGGGILLVRPEAPNSADSILMWIDQKEDLPWDLSHPDQINKELRALGATPLATSLYRARDYYREDRIPNDPASACRRYFVLLITDGLETCGGNPVAAASNLRRVVVDGVTHDIETYVLAVAIRNPALDQIARAGGTEHAYYAENQDEIVNALGEIFWQIRQKAFSFTAPEVVGIRGLRVGYQDKMYVASFIPSTNPIWEGHLKAFELPPDGILPVDEYGYPTIDPEWDAGELLRERDPSSRNIYTYKDGGLVELSSLEAEDFGLPTDELRDSLITLIYGDVHGDLGDIFHSTPVLIGNPNPFYVDEGYMEFRIDMKSTRDWTILAGSNDGLFHAFSDSTGEEIWAFCPPDLLTKLPELLAAHDYFVDGSPSASDVWFPSNSSDPVKTSDEWHTVVMFGERDGGRYYTLLDVTDTRNPEYLLSFSDSLTGYTWSQPEIYKLKLEIGTEPHDRFCAFFGGGYWPDTLWDFNDPIGTDVKGNCIYILNIWGAVTGEDLIPDYYSITYDGADEELAYMMYPIPGAPVLAKSGETHSTFLGRYEYLYKDLLWIGDMKGQLWRVDMRNPDPENWVVKRLFVANTDIPAIYRPIFFGPATTMDENGQRWVYFGTGNRADPCGELEDNCFFAIKDGDYDGYLTTSDLKRLSPNDTYDPSEPYMGWYVRFSDYGNGIGEKVYSSPVIVADTVYFTTFQPDASASNPCESGSGIARLYKFHYLTGGFEGDEPYEEIGSGIPQTPIVSTDMLGNTVLVISCGEGGITTIRGATGEGRPKRTIWWRDIKGGPSRF